MKGGGLGCSLGSKSPVDGERTGTMTQNDSGLSESKNKQVSRHDPRRAGDVTNL